MFFDLGPTCLTLKAFETVSTDKKPKEPLMAWNETPLLRSVMCIDATAWRSTLTIGHSRDLSWYIERGFRHKEMFILRDFGL